MRTETTELTEVPTALEAITPEGLTPNAIEMFLWMVKQGDHSWVEAATMERLTCLLGSRDYLRILLEYTVPTLRDQLIAMWTYGFAGARLTPGKIADQLSEMGREYSLDLAGVRRVQAQNSRRLALALTTTQEQLDSFRGDCLSTLGIDPVMATRLAELGVRLISQLTDWTPEELAETLPASGFDLAGLRLALMAHPDRLTLRDDTRVF